MAATSRYAVRIGDADCFFRVDEKARFRAGETALLVLNPARICSTRRATGRCCREAKVKPAPFEYHRPQSLAEALNLLAGLGDGARPLAGGQSLVPMMNMRIARPEHLIDLNDLAGLDFIRET